MSGTDQAVTASAAGTDEDALRCLEAVLLSFGMGTAYVAAMPGAGVGGAACAALRVFGSAGVEVASVVIAPRARTFLVSLARSGDDGGDGGDGDTARLLPFRTALEAAAMICPYRERSAVPGSTTGSR
ncbi:hypothetical protein [Acrocarpospora sp. B8E8]|uniref:hypothetical protein n=1 Tax=Acrocarpospora sp. B8E8 TaxID=3153572 RepID=UPI00325D6646